LINALRDAAASVRANSAWALGRIENGRALKSLQEKFSDEDALVRQASVAAVGQIDSTSSVPSIVRVLQRDDNANVRRVAAWALAELEAEEAVDPLLAVAQKDGDWRVREMATWALGELVSRRAIPTLISIARSDANDRVREVAVWALGELEDRSAADAVAGMTSDKNTRVRGTAAWALGQILDEAGHAPAGLIQLLKDESDDTRLKAAWALGQIGDPAAVTAIRDAMGQQKSTQMRKALIRALLKSGERSQAVITQLLDSPDPEVREAAIRGLAGNNRFDPWPWPMPRPRPFPN
jgi:HEAT repeat protein